MRDGDVNGPAWISMLTAFGLELPPRACPLASTSSFSIGGLMFISQGKESPGEGGGGFQTTEVKVFLKANWIEARVIHDN